ncbi:MAG TPA: hypothetical protein VHO48_06175, partial [Anaerolineaceae bacterium]|nr:hypothetical protein [Anaerolineaceae bacterium]
MSCRKELQKISFGSFRVLFGSLLLLLLFCSWQAFGQVTFNGIASAADSALAPNTSVTAVAFDTSGNLYYINSSVQSLVKIDTAGNKSTFPIPYLQGAGGLAVDNAGNGYIASPMNGVLLKVPTTGGPATQVADSTVLTRPLGVAVAPDGTVYVANNGRNQIIAIRSGVTSVFAISGASLDQPCGVTVDASGNLYIVESHGSRIVKFTPQGAGTVLPITGAADWPGWSEPTNIALAADGLYMPGNNHSIVKITSSGTGSVVPVAVPLSAPLGFAIDKQGTFYIGDLGNNQFSRVEWTADFGHLQLRGGAPVTLNLPFTVGSGSLTSVTAYTSGIQNLDFTIGSGNGTPCITGTTNTNCTVNVLFTPTAPGLRRGALVLNYDSGASLTVPLHGIGDAPVAALSPAVASTISVGDGSVSLDKPFQAVLDGIGNIYVTNYLNSTVTKVPAGGGQATPVNISIELNEPTGLAMDGAGNLFIASAGHNQIVELTAGGVSSILAINGLNPGLSFPTALAFDEAGNLWINDTGNGRIIKVTPDPSGDGTVANGIASVVGTGSFTLGKRNSAGLAVDTLGNLYIPDVTNNGVFKVTPYGVATALDFSAVGSIGQPQGVASDG